MPIYCDESGYTGNNLLNREQPFFAYTGVKIEPDEAEEYVRWFKHKFRIQQGELKAQKLLSRPKGRDAVTELLLNFKKKTKTACSLKKFSLSCKFFEYIFEPLLAKNNSVFYQCGFHLFIAYAIYSHTFLSDSSAEELLEDFESFMRGRTLSDDAQLFSKKSEAAQIVELVMEFAFIHRDKILEEFSGLGVLQRWILDDSISHLYPILTHWTEEAGDIRVICDESKPIASSRELLDTFVGRKDQFWQELNGQRWAMIPHLTEPVTFASSFDEPGLQIADIMASATCYMLKNKDICPQAKKWIDILFPTIINAIFPDHDRFSRPNHEVLSHMCILESLIDRSRRGDNLLHGIDLDIALARLAAKTYLMRTHLPSPAPQTSKRKSRKKKK